MTDHDPLVPPHSAVYTLNEAAAKLRMSRRALQNIIALQPFYSKNGKVYLFSERDLLNIWESMRKESNERLKRLGIPRDISQWTDEQLKNPAANGWNQRGTRRKRR